MNSDTTDTVAETPDEDPRSDGSDAAEDPTERLDGESFLEREQARRAARKEYVVEYADGAEAVFEYRMLEESEKDQIEEAHTTVEQRRNRDPEVSVDASALRTDLILAGVTDTPAGLKLTHRTVEQLSPDTREGLANAIDEFASMDPETRQTFR